MTIPPLVILHVGTMKSGTTYLQSRLEQHRDRLAENGWLFPGPRWKDQMRAAGDALTRAGAGEDLHDGTGPWGRMRAQLLGWRGEHAVLSVEHLSRASTAQAGAIVAALEPCAVRVILTARDLGRAIPSAWQQELKAGSHEPFATFVRAVAGSPDADDPPGLRGAGDPDTDEVVAEPKRRFWRLHDSAVHARNWGAAVGAENLVVVTVPRPGSAPNMLWRRFCDAVGLDPDAYPAEDSDLVLNPSLGAAGAEVVRRVNERLHRQPDALPQSVHRDLVKFTITNSTLAGLAGDQALQVPQRYDDWLGTRARKMADEILASGVRVVGDLADLVPDASAAVRVSTGLPARTTADAAVLAAAALIRRTVRDSGARPRSRKRRTVLAEQVAAARSRVTEDVAGDRGGGADEPDQGRAL